MKTSYICYKSMFMKRLVLKCGKLQHLGNRIIANEKQKINFYNTPPADYEDYIRHQEELIYKFKKEVSNLYKTVKKNEQKFDSLKIGPF